MIRRFRSTRRAAVVLALVVLALTFVVPSANAVDRRQPTWSGEIDALYRQVLRRAPDPAGWATYGSLAQQDCRWGLLRASYDILTSAEASARRPTVVSKVDGLYRALLARPADQSGLATYVALSRRRGFPRAVTDIMSSTEYRNRLAGICGKPDGTNVLRGAEVWKVLRIQFDVAINNFAPACMISGLGNVSAIFLAPPVGLTARLAALASATSAAAGQAHGLTLPVCKSTYQMLKGIAATAWLASQDYPVATRFRTGKKFVTCSWEWLSGTDPSAGARRYAGSYTCF